MGFRCTEDVLPYVSGPICLRIKAYHVNLKNPLLTANSRRRPYRLFYKDPSSPTTYYILQDVQHGMVRLSQGLACRLPTSLRPSFGDQYRGCGVRFSGSSACIRLRL